MVFGVDGSEARAIASRKVETLRDGGTVRARTEGLCRPSRSDTCLAESCFSRGLFGLRGESASYRDVDVDGIALPTWVKGTVTTPDDGYVHLVVGVAVNGRVAAVTRTHESGRRNYSLWCDDPP